MLRQCNVRICSFDAGPRVTARINYADFKKEVLRAGKFSVFEATANDRAARLYTSLCRDPEIEITLIGFPWTQVKKKR